MKLYYHPGACSLAPHIVAREARIPLELEKVDLQTKLTDGGRDFSTINAKGYVPALQLDDGEVLTEGPVVIQYLADQKPESNLAPAAGTRARYRFEEMLVYINSELHKAYGPLFNPAIGAEARSAATSKLQKRYALIEKALSKHGFLLGDEFTAADAYLFTITSWAEHLKVDLSEFPRLLEFQKNRRPTGRAGDPSRRRIDSLAVKQSSHRTNAETAKDE